MNPAALFFFKSLDVVDAIDIAAIVRNAILTEIP
jgi:hypothetical protein